MLQWPKSRSDGIEKVVQQAKYAGCFMVQDKHLLECHLSDKTLARTRIG